MTDPEGGCRIFESPMFEGAYIKWDGKCEQGKATGSGTVEFIVEGIVYWKMRIGEGTGIALEDGRFETNIDAEALSMTTDCDDFIKSYRIVTVDIPAKVDLRFNPTVGRILDAAEEHILRACPVMSRGRLDLSNVVVKMIQKGELRVRARSSPGNPRPVWREFTNRALSTAIREAQERVRNERRLREYEARAAAEAKAARETRGRAEEWERRRLDFVRTNQVQVWTDARSVANGDATYPSGVIVGFEASVSQDLGDGFLILTGPVLASGPATAGIIIAGERPLWIAGRIVGSKSFGGQRLLHLELTAVADASRE